MFNNSSKSQKWGYQDLMQYRIHEILLVSSPYDAFILEEDGKLTEQILSEYIGMNLSYAPRVWSANSAKNAIEMIENRFFDVIIVMMRISDMDPINFSKRIKKNYPKKPIVLLAFDQSEIKNLSIHDQDIFDEIFIWSGNSNVFPAVIKSMEIPMFWVVSGLIFVPCWAQISMGGFFCTPGRLRYLVYLPRGSIAS